VFRLDSKVALTTGAGSGIGREIALLYPRQGARVVITDLNVDATKAVAAEITAQYGQAGSQVSGGADETQVQRAVELTVKQYGRLDILVNNAGISTTRAIAIDFAGHGIRANAIYPGMVHPLFVENYLSQNYPDTKEAVRQQLHARQPLGRMGRPEEIAHAALYLASDKAAFVTGSTLVRRRLDG
jgi:NAD(P)-dependent dehydrogenase (short-subunit alcohol dehydrogenase family)